MRVQGTWNTVPIDTRAARRNSGSWHEGVTSTASMPSAAAERKMAPMLVELPMSSSTAMRRAPVAAMSSGTLGSAGRSKTASALRTTS